MSRMARAVLPAAPRYVTQRGVNRQDVFFSGKHRAVHLRPACNQQGTFCDNAGNLQSVNGDWMTYDAENRQTSEIDGVTQAVETYAYDGDGRRVEKSGPAGTTAYIYDAFGLLIAEYSTAGSGMSCQTCYLSYDHLGSVRMVTDQNANVVSRHDYLPFGVEIPAGIGGRSGAGWGSTDNITQRFTGQVRDSETGVDYFNARYFTAPLGRFNSPDPGNIGAEPTDPQSWNAYSYTGNNPLSRTDPEGLDYHVCVNDQNGNQQCTDIASDQAFQQVAKNPGAGLTVSGDNGSGVIYSTGQNGNQVPVGTYQHFVGPGTEGGGITEDFGTELAVAGLGARLLDAGAGLIRGVAGVFGRNAGTSAAEDAAAAAGNAFRASVEDVIQKARSVVGTQQVQVAGEDVAEQAAEEFLGPGARPISGTRPWESGEAKGWVSTDGQRVVRSTHLDSGGGGAHWNFVNHATGGNLHVYIGH